MPLLRCLSVLLIYFLVAAAWPAFAGDENRVDSNRHRPATADDEVCLPLITGENPLTESRLMYMPAGYLYPPYAADPIRVGFGIQPVHVTRGRIPDASDSRINLRAGAEIGLVRSYPPERPDLGWQLNLLGGFNDQNDVRFQLDNIGWDGRYGLVLTAALRKDVAFKAGLLHVSSHVGDEYIERTGRQRIGYTRQEIAGGASWFMSERGRVYAEAGRAVTISNNELMAPWRAQFGFEYESSPRFWQRRAGWYAALDAQSFEERDWRIDVAVQTGFVLRSSGRPWRLGVEWYRGRPPVGEFFQFTERYISLGVWIDV